MGFLTSAAPSRPVTVRWNPPFTLTTLTPGPLVLRSGEPAVLRFEVCGRPGEEVELRIMTPTPAVAAWFTTVPCVVTAGPTPIDVSFTPAPDTPPGTVGNLQGLLSELEEYMEVNSTPPIPFEVRRDPATGG